MQKLCEGLTAVQLFCDFRNLKILKLQSFRVKEVEIYDATKAKYFFFSNPSEWKRSLQSGNTIQKSYQIKKN